MRALTVVVLCSVALTGVSIARNVRAVRAARRTQTPAPELRSEIARDVGVLCMFAFYFLEGHGSLGIVLLIAGALLFLSAWAQKRSRARESS